MLSRELASLVVLSVANVPPWPVRDFAIPGVEGAVSCSPPSPIKGAALESVPEVVPEVVAAAVAVFPVVSPVVFPVVSTEPVFTESELVCCFALSVPSVSEASV
jgi:hypothetical protein